MNDLLICFPIRIIVTYLLQMIIIRMPGTFSVQFHNISNYISDVYRRNT